MGTLVSSTNKTDHHDITKILLKVALNTITITIVYLYVFFAHFYEKVCRGRCALNRISQSFTCFYIYIYVTITDGHVTI